MSATKNNSASTSKAVKDLLPQILDRTQDSAALQKLTIEQLEDQAKGA
jgi:hypothetical protein